MDSSLITCDEAAALFFIWSFLRGYLEADVSACPAVGLKICAGCWPLSAVGGPSLKTHLVLLITENRPICWFLLHAAHLQKDKPSSFSGSLCFEAFFPPCSCCSRKVSVLRPTTAVVDARPSNLLSPKEATEGFFDEDVIEGQCQTDG